ncbi:MAG: hypothetical protein N2Z65_01375 [Clostridiales bacterium]|nr:hypothetical protein [Clostridiales bacterium]
MLAGKIYDTSDEGLALRRTETHKLCKRIDRRIHLFLQ